MRLLNNQGLSPGSARASAPGATEPLPSEGHQEPGVVGNERLTALAGAVLLILIVAEVATVASIRSLISVHIFVGIALAGPLAVKTASTGWRFIRYYTRDVAYRRKGPPSPLLRVLAPLLLIATLVEIGSGIALVTTSPGNAGALVPIHHAAFVALILLVAIHLLAYIGRVPRLIASDWRHYREQQAPGRGPRLTLNLAAIILGVIAAILTMPAFDAWIHW